MAELVLIWIALLALCVAMVSRRDSSGALLLAYFLGLSLIHVPGAIGYLGNAAPLADEQETYIGFEATLIGMAALLSGALVMRFLGRRQSARQAAGQAQLAEAGRLLLFFGIVAFFVTLPLSSLVPSLTSLVGSVASLLIIGYWAYLKDASLRRDPWRTLFLLASLPLLPLLTLATGGFVGYGVTWVLAVLCFLFAISRYRILFILAAPVAAWIGLSVGVAYLEQRTLIREAVWHQNAGFEERLDRILGIVDRFELYDYNDPRHVDRINARLNQNYLVGAGITQHRLGAFQLMHGATVPLWALVPRAVWADKPSVGGGGTLVSKLTGIRFDENTSVGAGQPLEFYANFGWPGLVIGFLLLGGIFAYCDRGLAAGFRTGNVRTILLFGMPGLALLQPGGNLLEILVAVVASLGASRLIAFGLRKAPRRQRADRGRDRHLAA